MKRLMPYTGVMNNYRNCRRRYGRKSAKSLPNLVMRMAQQRCVAAWMPLALSVALAEAEVEADGQADGFGSECEGHCGYDRTRNSRVSSGNILSW